LRFIKSEKHHQVANKNISWPRYWQQLSRCTVSNNSTCTK